MDWGMVSAISTASMALVVLIAAIVAARQLKEISKSRKVDTFMRLSEYMQREEIRKARGLLISISGKDYKDWLKEEVKAAEPMIKRYQRERGKDFWHNFERLYEEAKKIKVADNPA